MRWYYLQHVPFEGPGYLARWAHEQGHEITPVTLWQGDSFPQLGDFDGLFVLGGPMNVDEEARYPWLAAEKIFLREAAAAGKAILGVCLGAQLLSVVLGGSVASNSGKEIGWYPVRLTRVGRAHALFRDFPAEFTAFHWHGDRFAIPPGGALTAESVACPHQAFVMGERVVGLQFHLEMTGESVASLIRHCPLDLAAGPWVQTPKDLYAGLEPTMAESHRLLGTLLSRLGEAGAMAALSF